MDFHDQFPEPSCVTASGNLKTLVFPRILCQRVPTLYEVMKVIKATMKVML